MREEVAKATLCQPRLTLAPLVHSDQYSITVSSRTKHTPSTPAHRHSHHLYPLLRIYIYIYIYICTCIYIHLVPFLRLHPPTLSLSPAITLFLSRFVSPLPSGSFPLCFTVVSSSNSLSLSLSFIRYSYYSLPSGSL